MNEKKSFLERAENFVAGKGFYIVLFVCAAIIAVSIWIIHRADADNMDLPLNTDIMTSDVAGQIGPNTASPNKGTTEPKNPDSAAETGTWDSGAQETAKSNDKNNDVNRQPVPEEVSNTEPADEIDISQLAFVRPVSGEISMAYSVDALIYSKTMADWRTHDGIDIAAQVGTKVLAAASGTVTHVYADDLYGTTIVIDHGAGLMSVYSNLAATPTVNEGDTVTGGDIIGSVGSTALAETGEVSHLHFSMTLNDEPVNPSDYLPKT